MCHGGRKKVSDSGHTWGVELTDLEMDGMLVRQRSKEPLGFWFRAVVGTGISVGNSDGKRVGGVGVGSMLRWGQGRT